MISSCTGCLPRTFGFLSVSWSTFCVAFYVFFSISVGGAFEQSNLAALSPNYQRLRQSSIVAQNPRDQTCPSFVSQQYLLQSTTKTHMLSTYNTAPTPLSSHTASVLSFEEKMRAIVLEVDSDLHKRRRLKKQRASSVSASTTATLVPLSNLFVANDINDYKQLVGDELSRMVVVRFYATWCRACKAAAPLFYKMAAKHPHTVFVEVPVNTRNAALYQGLGVPSFPFGHLYHPTLGLVEEMKLTRNFINAFEMKLDCYLDGCCDLESQPRWILSDIPNSDYVTITDSFSGQGQ